MSKPSDTCTDLTMTLRSANGLVSTENFSEAEARAFAKLVNRLSWVDFQRHATDEPEAHLIKQGFDKMQHALLRAGYDQLE